MAEEPQVSLPTEELRYCPSCGARVALRATSCIMCGASLVEEEVPQEEAPKKGLPNWVRVTMFVVVAALIVGLGGFGIYALISARPEVSLAEVTATPTHTPRPTLTPTQTPTLGPTPTPIPPRVHQVQTDETLISIAEDYDTTVEHILSLNPDISPELLQVGYLLLIPVGTPTPTPSPTLDPNQPTPTLGSFIVHVVMGGESLGGIAEQYGVSVAVLRQVNDLPAGDDTIFANQSLVIPVGTPMPSPTPTVDPQATPTPIPLYPAPALLNPPDDMAVVGDDIPVLLQWTSVSVLRDNEVYELSLYQPAGGVISATIYTQATAWRVDEDLMAGVTDDSLAFSWQVQVVRKVWDSDGDFSYEPASGVSEERSFVWLRPTPTPTPTPLQ